MAIIHSIEIYLPSEVATFEEGIDGCQSINVKYYFANVVHINVYFTDGSVQSYYQCPCVLYTSPPI